MGESAQEPRQPSIPEKLVVEDINDNEKEHVIPKPPLKQKRSKNMVLNAATGQYVELKKRGKITDANILIARNNSMQNQFQESPEAPRK